MTSMSAGLNGVKRWLGAATIALFVACALPASPAQSQADAIAPVEDFSRELDELKKTFTDLGKQIDDSAKSIDGLTDVQRARKEIEELRGPVGKLLSAVADNGELSNLGTKALERAEEKLKSLDRDSRFKPEEQQVPDRPVARAQGRDRARHQANSACARKEFAEPVAHAADERGLHRRAGADPASQQGDRGDPRAHRRKSATPRAS